MNALPSTQSTVAVPDMWITLLRSSAMLFIVLGIIVAVLFVMKRLFYSQSSLTQRGAIKLLASHYITPKERILLIDVLGEKILVGATPQNINCITKIDSNAEPTVLDDDIPSGFFTDLLKGSIGRGTSKNEKNTN